MVSNGSAIEVLEHNLGSVSDVEIIQRILQLHEEQAGKKRGKTAMKDKIYFSKKYFGL